MAFFICQRVHFPLSPSLNTSHKMSSTLNMSSILSSIASLEKQLAALKSQLGAPESVSMAVAAPAKKEKKERKRSDAAPSAWRVFADRVRGLLKDNGYTGNALGTQCVQFCSTLKDENADFATWTDEDVLARRAAWTAPEVSKQKAAGKSWRKPKTGSSSASVVSTDSAPAPAPAPVAEVSDGEAVSVASSSKKPGPPKGRKWSEETKAAAAAKRAAKKAAKTAAVADASASVVAPPPLPASPDQSDDEGELSGFQRMSLGGAKYWVNLENGHCYRRDPVDDSRGDWAGLFSRSPRPSIDDSVPEPNAELNFTDLDELD
jgi:hypothetical protein